MNIDKATAILKSELIVKPVRISVNASIHDKIQTITHVGNYDQGETLKHPVKLRGSPDIEVDSFHIYMPRSAYENIKASLGLSSSSTEIVSSISVDVVASSSPTSASIFSPTSAILSVELTNVTTSDEKIKDEKILKEEFIFITPQTLTVPEKSPPLKHYELSSIDSSKWLSFGYVDVKPKKDYFGTFYVGIKRLTITTTNNGENGGRHIVYIDSDGSPLHPFFAVRKQVFPPRYLLHALDSSNHIESSAFVGTHLSFEPPATNELIVRPEFKFYDTLIVEVAPRLNIDAGPNNSVKVMNKKSHITSEHVKHPNSPTSVGVVIGISVVVIFIIFAIVILTLRYKKKHSLKSFNDLIF